MSIVSDRPVCLVLRIPSLARYRTSEHVLRKRLGAGSPRVIDEPETHEPILLREKRGYLLPSQFIAPCNPSRLTVVGCRHGGKVGPDPFAKLHRDAKEAPLVVGAEDTGNLHELFDDGHCDA